MKKNYMILAALIITGMLQQLNADEAGFRNIIEDSLSVRTIKASITQHIYTENGTVELYSGNYYAAAKGFIRIDYLHPEIQNIIVNNSGLFWYYPGRKLLFLSEKKGQSTASTTIPVLMNVIPYESLKNIDVVREGMRVYSFLKTAEVYSITSKTNKTKMLLWVDPVLKIIKRKTILDESGREIMKEEYAEHARIEGVYIPSKIELTARTSDGIIHTVTEYSGIVINGQMDKDFFVFRVTPQMKVRVLSDR